MDATVENSVKATQIWFSQATPIKVNTEHTIVEQKPQAKLHISKFVNQYLNLQRPKADELSEKRHHRCIQSNINEMYRD